MSNNNNIDPYSFLKNPDSAGIFHSVENLREKSFSITISSFVYPEILVAALTIFHKRYPTSTPKTMSSLVSKIIESYVRDNIDAIGSLPPTDESIRILTEHKFISPGNSQQGKRIAKALQKFDRYKEKNDQFTDAFDNMLTRLNSETKSEKSDVWLIIGQTLNITEFYCMLQKSDYLLFSPIFTILKIKAFQHLVNINQKT